MLRDRDGGSEKATRVSNLLSRLLEQPVLSQKSAILLLLNDLAEDSSIDENALRSDTPPREPPKSYRNRNGILDKSNQPPAFEDAFAPNGLPLLPAHENHSKQGAVVIEDGYQKHRPGDESTVHTLGKDRANGVDTVDTVRPTEVSLLHDLPFTLQGLSSNHLPFSSRTTLDLPSTLPLPMISLLHTLAEPSLLYRSLSDFVDSRDEGLVGQSLRSTIGMELRSYLGLIATLEGEIRRAIASVHPEDSRRGIGKAGVTLKRCVVWTREATMGLRLMSLMAEKAKSRQIPSDIFVLLTLCRQERRSIDHDDPLLFLFSRRSFRGGICGKDAHAGDAAILRHAPAMDIRR